MSDYGRIPQIEQPNPQKEEKEIFDKPQVENNETDKKLALKEHLAKCRQKSLEVRKAKAEEKKKNKRPRGRPKKENINMEIRPNPEPQPDPSRPTEKEIFVKEEIKTNEAFTPPPPQSHSMFDMEMLLSKIDDRLDKRFENFKPPTQPTPNEKEPPQYFKYMKEMKEHEEMIRNDERVRISKNVEQKKQEALTQSTNNYFRKMPPANYINPTQNGNTAWDNLLNPRQKY